MILIAGPCVMESQGMCLEIARELQHKVSHRDDIELYFKASFEKANRTSKDSFRGVGISEGVRILESVKELGLRVTTDVHECHQIQKIAPVVDLIQIPAFLCRQTRLLEIAGQFPINIKKGQFMSPEQMESAVNKCESDVYVTERGTCFGYGDLVVDFRSIVKMRKFANVIFDCTHSVQKPGQTSSGGEREFIPYLTKAAKAVGVDGFFIETHPNPGKALSDKETQWPLKQIDELLELI